MSIVKITNNKTQVDVRKSQQLINQCFELAVEKTPSMRNVLQGDIESVVRMAQAKKVA